MAIVRFPDHLALHEGIFRGDNEIHVDLWKRGKNAGEWQHMKSARNPEGIDVAPKIIGVSVTVSEWKEVVRRGIAKLFGRKEKGNDTIPLGAGKTIEVQNMMKGLRYAVLAWGKEAGVVFDEKLIAELFPKNEGYEVLGEKGDLCLVHGKAESLVPKPAIAAVPRSPEETIHPCQRFIDEVEAKFAHRIKLADYPEGTHIPGLECLETELAKRALAAFREAEAKGMSSTEIYIPKNARGVASLILLLHQDTFQEIQMRTDVCHVQAELFRLMHLLRSHGNIEHLFFEGGPYDTYSSEQAQLKHIKIPGTNFQLFSDAGQQYFCNHPAKLEKWFVSLCQTSKKAGFHHALWFQQFNVQSAESPDLLSKGDKFLETYGEMMRYGRSCYSMLLNELELEKGVTPRVPANVVQGLQHYLEALEAVAVLQRDREQQVLRHTKRITPVGVPHVVFGEGHRYPLLDLHAKENIAVLLTVPQSTRTLPLGSTVLNTGDERDRRWTGVQYMLSLLENSPYRRA